ncbi:MAG: hypothetical protein OEW18_13745 [Candidatus Aminicenantes bacterium]|nr:hypothetical protein [Candidatus Aminicenantes bacterium]
MKDFWARFATSDFRWIARISGTIIGLLALMEFIEGLGYLGQLEPRGYVLRVGFFLVFAGCAVGWFKEFAASLLILGGTAIFCVIAVGSPGALRLIMFPALVGGLYLCIHLGTKKT